MKVKVKCKRKWGIGKMSVRLTLNAGLINISRDKRVLVAKSLDYV